MSAPLSILALEPYFGGSHRAFLDGWTAHSGHQWTVLGLPARKWKWRMRTAAIDFARETSVRRDLGASWDLVFCSDMLDLATFLGLAPRPIRALPTVAYFHENQLTYPYRLESERDFSYGVINVTTALAATQSWFNSTFHRASFLLAAEALLRRVPDHHPAAALGAIRSSSRVQPPGMASRPPARARAPGPLRILWAARWEHDKNPETFFEALHILAARGIDFRADVLGEQFREAPPVFQAARAALGDRVDRWGFVSRQAYLEALGEADVFVSTALHEFFGLAAVEAAAAGAFLLLPRRLAYPEVFQAERHPAFFYDGSAGELADRLADLADTLTDERPGPACSMAAGYDWAKRARAMDKALLEVVRGAGEGR